jgi:hypothetical protein
MQRPRQTLPRRTVRFLGTTAVAAALPVFLASVMLSTGCGGSAPTSQTSSLQTTSASPSSCTIFERGTALSMGITASDAGSACDQWIQIQQANQSVVTAASTVTDDVQGLQAGAAALPKDLSSRDLSRLEKDFTPVADELRTVQDESDTGDVVCTDPPEVVDDEGVMENDRAMMENDVSVDQLHIQAVFDDVMALNAAYQTYLNVRASTGYPSAVVPTSAQIRVAIVSANAAAAKERRVLASRTSQAEQLIALASLYVQQVKGYCAALG